MKVIGIVAEFNPLHNGHKYLIDQAKKNNADLVIAVMSGEFLQSGEVAFASKELRTQLALKAGADIVFLLPAMYSTGSAEIFASGAISILDSLACVDELVFGSEFEDTDKLIKLADILNNEPEDYKKLLQNNLRSGMSFPSARAKAISVFSGHEEYAKILSSPNSILGIEYCRALLRLKSGIRPVAVKRTDSGYHSFEADSAYISATAIRKLFDDNNTCCDILLPFVPECLTSIYYDNFNKEFPVFRNDIMPYLLQRLFSADFEKGIVYELSEDLKNHIYKSLKNDFSTDYEKFVSELNSKNTTYGHISRVFAHLLLNIRDKPEYKCPYARILGFTENGKRVLHEIKKNAAIPLITGIVQGRKLLSQSNESERALKYFETDILAYNLYHLILKLKYNTAFIPESTRAFMAWKGDKNE